MDADAEAQWQEVIERHSGEIEEGKVNCRPVAETVRDIRLSFALLGPLVILRCHQNQMLTEADTCRKCVVPKLQSAGWDNDPHSIAEQRFFTDGRIIVRGD